MALVLANRVKETTTTTGTGTITLAGAATGFQSFSAVGDGNTTYYCIAGQGTVEWEVGIGTYTSAGTTLSRTTVLASSNAGSLVTFSAGTKDVFVTYPSSKSVYTDFSGTVSGLSIGGNAATVTNGVYTTDTATVTNTMLAGSIANAKLVNSAVTINGNAVSLGGSVTVTATATNALTISSPLSGTSYNGSSAVSIGLASGYGDTQNPYASKTANYVLAAPTGVAGVPTFRAIVAADIPTLNQNTTGSAGSVANALTAGTGISFSSGTTYNGSAALTINCTVTSPIPAGTVMLFYQAAAPTGWTQVTTQNNKDIRVVSGTGGGTGGTVAYTTAFASQTPAGTVSVTAGVGTLAVGIGTLAAGIGTLAAGVGTLSTGNTTATGTNSGGAVSAYTLATANIPSHTHSSPSINVGLGCGGATIVSNAACGAGTALVSNGTGGGGSHTHAFTQPTFTGTAHNHTVTGSPSISGAPSLSGTPSISGAPSITSATFSGTAINLAVQYIDVIICSKN